MTRYCDDYGSDATTIRQSMGWASLRDAHRFAAASWLAYLAGVGLSLARTIVSRLALVLWSGKVDPTDDQAVTRWIDSTFDGLTS
jgi:hypothetical protein